jgi:murein DD-endopeptidase MepM/ murein hydrolase activator NlpD
MNTFSRAGCGLLVFLCATCLGLAALPSISAPASVRQGDPILVWLRDSRPVEEGRAEFRSPSGKLLDSVPVFEARSGQGVKIYGFIFAADMDARPGAYELVVSGREAGPGPGPAGQSLPGVVAAGRANGSAGVAATKDGGFRKSLVIGIEARKFSHEEIRLDGANTEIRSRPDPRKDAEALRLYEILGTSDEGAVFLDSGLALPAGLPRRSAGFGDRRRYLYAGGGSEASVHAGVDIACPQGTPVRACAAGRVVFAGMRIVTGNTVILEHLPGLYSIYMHLSELKVSPGFLLGAGELLGLSGSTGLSTGPHLHWELRVRGKAVDPDYWVSSPPLDKNMPIGKMVSAIEGG